MASDEELAAQRKKLDDLRQQVADAKAAQSNQIREAQNDSVLDALKVEEDRLKAELAAVKGTQVTDAPVANGNGKKKSSPADSGSEGK